MASSTEGRLENLEITVEGIKAETIAIRRDVQQIMRALGTQTNHHNGQSDDSSVNENQRWGEEEDGGRGVGNQPEGQKQVTLPIFEGIDPVNWIYDAEIFFELRGAAEEEKVRLACMSMEGSAGFWVRAWKEKAKNRSWAGLKAGLINRFGGGFRGTAYEQLATLRQDGMEEFARSFEILLGQTQGLSEELVLGFFLAGLREEIKGQVQIQDPQDLMIAMRIARDVEDAINRARGGVWNGVKVNPVGTRPTSTIVRGDSDRHFATRTGGVEEVGTIIREGSTVASNTNPRGNTMEGGDSRGRMVRNLPYPEFLKRREEGHRCSEKSLRVLLLAEEEEDEVTEGENSDTNPYTVSLGDCHKRTSRGPCEKIRINLGEATVEEELKLPIIDTSPYPVSQGDGHRRMTRGRCEKVRISFEEATLEEEFYAFDLGEVDAILGVAWLGKLGELLINWEEMTMVYYLEGKRIRISGHQASKLTNVESWAIVWKRDQVEKQVEDEWQADLTGEQGSELQLGLQAHYHVFQEKQGLLPLRDIQHRIPLKDAAMLYTGQLYTTARVSSFVLTYYGLCLINENYTIKFHFAEIIFIHEKSLNSLGKRVFGVYIQGNLVLEDFDIQGEAGGTGRPIVKTFNASFTHHTLKIHFYWAGKGTPGISTRGVYGPLVYANLVGEDEFGYMLADILKENNVNHEGMRFDPGARTALSFVTLRSDGEREFMFYRNPRVDMLLQEDELDLDLIRKAKIFHYGSVSLITEPCNSAHIAAAKVANDVGVVLSYDPNLRLPLWPSEDSAREGILSIWETADIIKVNEEEISFLTKGEDPYDDAVVRKLFHENLKLLLVTKGAKGCRYYTKEFSGRVKGLKVDVVDTTSAGDAFVAGMLSQLAANLSLIQKEEELRDSLKFANVCGALTFGYPGLIPEFNLGDKVVEEGGNDRRPRVYLSSRASSAISLRLFLQYCLMSFTFGTRYVLLLYWVVISVRRLVGKLIYLNTTRPDLSYPVGIGLLYKNKGSTRVEGYCDANWTGCPIDRRSIIGYCVLLGGNLVSWKSKKQSVFARSSAKAEYRSMALTTCELVWIKQLLQELKFCENEKMKLYCDNQATLHIASNLVFHERTKHKETNCHFVREKLLSKDLVTEFISSNEQLANILTKSLREPRIQFICSTLGIYDLYVPA
ncbi:hypothetical protein V8G54_018407 [Vigna mungo]|uniref:Carbohydrate kinase PfkB domain-containing protein n=1 Tax=Vigna mungo TaxID=3915 RepID=A0AAQ3NA36_VIGMU